MQNNHSSVDYNSLRAVANTVRVLTIDALEASTTGHPGMPLGMADVGAVLFGEILNHDPKAPDWLNRDRFVLSAGHGSMLLYSLLHLSGYNLPLEELKRLRRLGSLTPGHPEYGHTAGVETTTGPLGAGFATAVGMAMAERYLGAQFNTEEHTIVDHNIYVISGDGCLMEGVSAEAASLAGHHKLGKLIVFYDSNNISIEGSTDITFTEDVRKRFEAYGWQVLEGSAHDMAEVLALGEEAKKEKGKPSLVILKSVIGYGSPNMQGKHKVHGSRLGPEEAVLARKNLGVPDPTQEFYVAPQAKDYFREKQEVFNKRRKEWESVFTSWKEANPGLADELNQLLDGYQGINGEISYPEFKIGEAFSTRDASGIIMQEIPKKVLGFLGGSADLAASNKTEIPDFGDFTLDNPRGRTIRFGVREHAMASITNGLLLYGLKAFCATLVVFIDYMRPAMRLAAIMNLPAVYILTHDSIYLGGDGPTHIPIEHLNSLRIIPNMRVLRPADPQETVVAWQMALERQDGPTALFLSRQDLAVFEKHDSNWETSLRQYGAYTVRDCEGKPDLVLLATGSEVETLLKAVEGIDHKNVRILSVLSREMLEEAYEKDPEKLIPEGSTCLVFEAGSSSGWTVFTGGNKKQVFSIDGFAVSGRPEENAEHFGYTPEGFLKFIKGYC